MGASFGWLLGGFLLLAVAGGAGLLCLFGWEAVQTGANIPGWLSLFLPGVVLPLVGSGWCFYKASRRPR